MMESLKKVCIFSLSSDMKRVVVCVETISFRVLIKNSVDCFGDVLSSWKII